MEAVFKEGENAPTEIDLQGLADIVVKNELGNLSKVKITDRDRFCTVRPEQNDKMDGYIIQPYLDEGKTPNIVERVSVEYKEKGTVRIRRSPNEGWSTLLKDKFQKKHVLNALQAGIVDLNER